MVKENYFDSPRLSQSKLKLLASDPRLFNTIKEPNLYYEEKKYFIIGSAVDCIITEGEEIFKKEYHISEISNKPSDTIKSILKQVFDIVIERFDTEKIGLITTLEYKEIILECCENHTYQPRYNENTRVNKICEHYEYWEDLKLSKDKQVLSSEEYSLIARIVLSLKTNEVTAPYFTAQNNKDMEVYYQLPIFFEYGEEECKSLLDMLLINHTTKKILPLDIKTMGEKTIMFPKNLRKRRYDIQGAFYTEALITWKKENNLEDYSIEPFKFIVESTTNEGMPLIFTCHKSLLHIGKYGRPPIGLKGTMFFPGEDGKLEPNEIEYGKIEAILGFHQLIALYRYYKENGFEQEIRVKESKSELLIDWNGIID